MSLKDLKGYSQSQLHAELINITHPCGHFLHETFTHKFMGKAGQLVSDDMRNKVAEQNPVILLKRLCADLVSIENVKTRLLEFTNHSAEDKISMGHASEALETLRVTIRKISIDCGGHVNILDDCETIVRTGYTMNEDQLYIQCATLAVVIGILENTPANCSSAPGASLQGLKSFLEEFGKNMPEEDFKKLRTMAMRTSY